MPTSTGMSASALLLLVLVASPLRSVQYVIESLTGGSVLPGPGVVPQVGGLVGPPAVTAPLLALPIGPPVLPSVGVAGSSLPAPGTLATGATAPVLVVPAPQFRRER